MARSARAQGERAVVIGCNCVKRQQYKFQYTAPSGETKVYNTEVEARAAVIRGGGTYTAVAK